MDSVPSSMSEPITDADSEEELKYSGERPRPSVSTAARGD